MDVLSQPLVSHPDARGTLKHQAETLKGLTRLQDRVACVGVRKEQKELKTMESHTFTQEIGVNVLLVSHFISNT